MKNPLINSKDLRNAIKYWSKYNEIDHVYAYIGTFDHGGVCLIDSLIVLKHYPSRLEFHYWINCKEDVLKHEHLYSIEELIGN